MELDHGRVWPRGTGPLPTRTNALLTALEPNSDTPMPATNPTGAGLHRLMWPDGR